MSDDSLNRTEKASTAADQQVSGSASTGKALRRSPNTDYGDGIIQYVHYSQKYKGQIHRLCGILGKDRLVSPTHCPEKGLMK